MTTWWSTLRSWSSRWQNPRQLPSRFPLPPLFAVEELDVIVAWRTKKADATEHPKVFDHVGLLINEPPSRAGLLSV